MYIGSTAGGVGGRSE